MAAAKHFAHYVNSCEVYVKGEGFRRTLYGLSREQVLDDHHLLSTVLGGRTIKAGWDEEIVVTATKKLALGLPAGWARVTRRFDEYGEKV